MKRIALIGAGGFVGSRMIEMESLGSPDLTDIAFVPVIRQARGIGRNSKLGRRDFVFANLEEPESLVPRIRDCSAVVNLTMGDDTSIVRDVAAIYTAARSAEVPLVIHISSAEVFGRCDRAGLHDDSPVERGHWMAYARAKAEAETWLSQRVDGPVVLILRPGLVWGPRSPWVVGPAGLLCSGNAWTIDAGKWACNLCHVDNLARAIVSAARRGSSGGCFNVGDPDRPTWAGYWAGLASEANCSQDVGDFPEDAYREGILTRLLSLSNCSLAVRMKRRIKTATKEALKANLRQFRKRFLPSARTTTGPRITKGLWWLQTTRYHLPIAKFSATFPECRYTPFHENIKQVGEWLRFSGYYREERH